MCVTFTGKWRRAERTIIAYKVAKLNIADVPQSFVYPTLRAPQSRKHRSKVGSTVQYKIGDTIKCKGYGFYLYRKPSDNYDNYFSPRCVLRVRIEKGSMYRLGRIGTKGHTTINARKITVLLRVQHPTERAAI